MSQELPVKQEQWLLWQRTGRGPNIHAWNQLTPSLQLPLRHQGFLAHWHYSFLKDLSNRLRQATGDESSYTYLILALFPGLPQLQFLIACSMQKLEPGKAWERGYLIQRLSVSVQRGNTALVLGTIGHWHLFFSCSSAQLILKLFQTRLEYSTLITIKDQSKIYSYPTNNDKRRDTIWVGSVQAIVHPQKHWKYWTGLHNKWILILYTISPQWRCINIQAAGKDIDTIVRDSLY